jgi:hypothetical protein
MNRASQTRARERQARSRARRAASHWAKSTEVDVVQSLEEAVELDAVFAPALGAAVQSRDAIAAGRAALRAAGVESPDAGTTRERRRRLTVRDGHDDYVRCPLCEGLSWLRDCVVVAGDAQRTLYDTHGPRLRLCGGCMQRKPLSEFWRRTLGDGWQTRCKACSRVTTAVRMRRARELARANRANQSAQSAPKAHDPVE